MVLWGCPPPQGYLSVSSVSPEEHGIEGPVPQPPGGPLVGPAQPPVHLRQPPCIVHRAPPRAHAGQPATAGHITVTYIHRGRSGFTECLLCTWATHIMITGAKQNAIGPHRTQSQPQTHESEVYKSHNDTTRPTLARNATLAVARTWSRYAVHVHACEWARMRMASIVTATSRLCSSRRGILRMWGVGDSGSFE